MSQNQAHPALTGFTPPPLPQRAFTTTMRALVAAPLLEFSERVLHFLHQYVKGAAIETVNRPLVIRWGESHACSHL